MKYRVVTEIGNRELGTFRTLREARGYGIVASDDLTLSLLTQSQNCMTGKWRVIGRIDPKSNPYGCDTTGHETLFDSTPLNNCPRCGKDRTSCCE
jgi:hypothetical protein